MSRSYLEDHRLKKVDIVLTAGMPDFAQPVKAMLTKYFSLPANSRIAHRMEVLKQLSSGEELRYTKINAYVGIRSGEYYSGVLLCYAKDNQPSFDTLNVVASAIRQVDANIPIFLIGFRDDRTSIFSAQREMSRIGNGSSERALGDVTEAMVANFSQEHSVTASYEFSFDEEKFFKENNEVNGDFFESIYEMVLGADPRIIKPTFYEAARSGLLAMKQKAEFLLGAGGSEGDDDQSRPRTAGFV